MSEAKGEQESTETLSFRCDCERCRFMRGRKGRFAPQDDMNFEGNGKGTQKPINSNGLIASSLYSPIALKTKTSPSA